MASSVAPKRILKISSRPLSQLHSRLYTPMASRCASCGATLRAKPPTPYFQASTGNMGKNGDDVRGESWKWTNGRRFYAASATREEEASQSLGHPSSIFQSTQTDGTIRETELKNSLRTLLREVAQPVAVVTSFMPSSVTTSPEHTAARLYDHPSRIPVRPHHPHKQEDHAFHGATLSSFSSIAMDPHPLVAFALRVPSRMAATLSSFAPPSLTVPSPSTSATTPRKSTSKSQHLNTHLVLNILSDAQHPLAHAFSRPDLHPHPFTSASYTLNTDGLPVLHGSLGALSCKVVGRVKLSELVTDGEEGYLGRHWGAGVVSELFIARVLRVEDMHSIETSSETVGGDVMPVEGQRPEDRTPLLYWRRGYTSCHES